MQLLRQLSAPIGMFVLFLVLTFIGIASFQAGWIALSLFCAWPLFWAVGAWTVRGLRDNYQLVPKAAQERRRAARPGEVFN